MVEWDFGEQPVNNEEIIEVENTLPGTPGKVSPLFSRPIV
ncbi:hypothetical protein BN2127_JRS7_03068 [Bacillus subtilis]|jgi:hypothetical protein|uniref:Uncharacterized protein n=1 Tax=Bacillus spizizenii (strain DSM 15029 / JCM 12233 / NBRC 101239 / NRRL B-23049 / TU-B-10) TaxID=1052585 RepID=G4NXF2_BACS4|nr:hypothetical protein GYO_2863 [Bacillus spizizenii TU-B-10]GEK27586.1 hypothetical protein BSU04nite_39750 [Bacillus spizizenii]CUB26508.1 hypothetical protein BN2127_JRS1_08481 [Bacillus cereus]CUB42841.1 hypothetical protein BN2127_JRS7_03068 [Bacillus subtilis]